MSRVLTNENNYYDIADTIRQMKEVNTTYKPREMAPALKDIYSNEVEGTLPLSVVSNGEDLLNYRIDGASGGVGNRTENLFDKDTITDNTFIKGNSSSTGNSVFSFLSDYIPVENTTTYTLSWLCEELASRNNRNAGVYDAGKNWIKTFQVVYYGKSSSEISLDTPNAAYIRLTMDKNMSNIMFKKGSTALPYEPFGYKIPVKINNTNIATIYLDSPIYANESISLSDTEVDIPTIDGTNVISIDTTVQPSNVYIQAPKDTPKMIEARERLEVI